MKTIVAKYNQTSLILRIAVGLIIGIILGIAVPQAGFLDILGTLFVGALKAIAPILVFVLVISSLAQARKGIGYPVYAEYAAGCFFRSDRQLRFPGYS